MYISEFSPINRIQGPKFSGTELRNALETLKKDGVFPASYLDSAWLKGKNILVRGTMDGQLVVDLRKAGASAEGYDEGSTRSGPQRIPFADNTFDIVISNLTARSEAPPLKEQTCEIARVLKLGGRFIASPLKRDDYRELRMVRDHTNRLETVNHGIVQGRPNKMEDLQIAEPLYWLEMAKVHP